MRVLQTNLSSVDFRDPEANSSRIARLEVFLAKHARPNSVVALPGGFLAYQQRARLQEAVGRLSEVAHHARVTLFGGIDIVKSRGYADDGETIHGALPFYGFAVGLVEASAGGPLLWQQTSTDSENFRRAPLRPDHGRLLLVPEGETKHRQVLVLICGELYRRDIDHLLRRQPALVVVCGHENMTETHHSLERVSARTGGLVVIAQHFVGAGSLLHAWQAGGRESVLGGDAIPGGDGERWLRATAWTL